MKKEILKVLIAEDSTEDTELIIRELQKDYEVIWKRVETESAFLLELGGGNGGWDVILCDYILPRFSVDKALVSVSEAMSRGNISETPFIIVSGSVDENVAIKYLKMGAYDFIGKDKLQRLHFAIDRELRHVGERKISRIRVVESYDSTIAAWGKALELRDIYTKGHTERVTSLSLKLAMRLNVSRAEFININRGAYLHDIGKMGIPDAVLLKRDELTRDERKIMEMHPILAYDMLHSIPFLENAVDIPYCHHERWNGRGYPRGLLEEETPLSARLFAVVDVYDALTNDRPYRKSWEKGTAIEYISNGAGELFDPDIVKVFVDMIGKME